VAADGSDDGVAARAAAAADTDADADAPPPTSLLLLLLPPPLMDALAGGAGKERCNRYARRA
jgi:hypothetical protein